MKSGLLALKLEFSLWLRMIGSFGLTLIIQSLDDFSVFRQRSFGQAKAAAV
jgi:hypothetical protein